MRLPRSSPGLTLTQDTPKPRPADHDAGAAQTPAPLAEALAPSGLFAKDGADVAGLLAYALHMRAAEAFEARFRDLNGRGPDPRDRAAFLVGETHPTRITAYRGEAERLLAARSATPVRQRSLWPRFGLAPPEALARQEQAPINWRGLALRLLILLFAVVTTAILLRVLFVRH